MGAVMAACQLTEAYSDQTGLIKNQQRPEKSHSDVQINDSENYLQRVIQFAQQGYTDIEFKTYDTDWDSEAYPPLLT